MVPSSERATASTRTTIVRSTATQHPSIRRQLAKRRAKQPPDAMHTSLDKCHTVNSSILVVTLGAHMVCKQRNIQHHNIQTAQTAGRWHRFRQRPHTREEGHPSYIPSYRGFLLQASTAAVFRQFFCRSFRAYRSAALAEPQSRGVFVH